MSKSFYNYIVEDLIVTWLQSNPSSNGSRYYIIVENEQHRHGIIEALKQKSYPITINGIFQGAALAEESYNTFALDAGANCAHLIIGDDTNANEDYLTTLRNSVGQPGKYENFGVLYILSKSVLSSLITASLNLEGLGGPLHPNHVVDCIQRDIKKKITKDLEQIYLIQRLEVVSQLIADGTATLFDFETMMAVLGAESIKGLYNSLGMFEDKSIYQPSFNTTDQEMVQRVELNRSIFEKVNGIMNADEEDKSKDLERFLDERLARRVAKSRDSWKEIDLQDYIDSESRRAATENLTLRNIELDKSQYNHFLVINNSGKSSKSSKNYIVLCEPNPASEHSVILSFNKPISKIEKTFKAYGNKIKVPIGVKPISLSVGRDNNRHDFYLLRLPCSTSLFHEIKQYFSLNKKGEITVKVPDEFTEISFGEGEKTVSLSGLSDWDWSENEKLTIPIDDEGEDTLGFQVNFGETNLKITLKLNVAKPLPPLKPDSFPQSVLYYGIDRDGVPFKKVTDGETERGVLSFWRTFLEWEQMFIENKCSAITLVFNDLTQHYDTEFLDLELPDSIQTSLLDIYDYFHRKETIPSLCPIDSELLKLYEAYCNATICEVEKIPVGQSLDKKYHNLTRLGTLYDGNKFYLSPFHPLIVAFILEYHCQSQGESAPYAKKLLSPFFLVPYLTFQDKPMRPFTDNQLEGIRNWLPFENAENKPQERANDITTKMVKNKMVNFIKNFSYLFQDKDSPIIISSIGLSNDSNLIKGIIEFIKLQYSKGVQRIVLHEYVNDLQAETFFEKLNRLGSIENIEHEIHNLYISTRDNDKCLEAKGEYTSQDIIHELFTRVEFFKHDINSCDNEIGYCHIAFYQMNTGSEYVNFPTQETRTELAFNGLISIPSTLKKNGNYFIGFGTKGVNSHDGHIHPMAIVYNNLYGNEKNGGFNSYNTSLAVTKKYAFEQSKLLESIYNNANWVTFLNPEVDINFFYQQDLYIVHYTDQYSVNAKYDSITVTKHIGLYENLLKKTYEKYALSEETFPRFNTIMKNYFNCLNGSWMLRLVNQTEMKVREKMSLVATSIMMRKFLQRNIGIIWIPISLDEILRVTGDIGLKMDSIFSKKSLGVKGVMSDDLLMIGLDAKDAEHPTIYFYPVEVKASNTSPMSTKGTKQVSQTWLLFKEHIFSKTDFETKIYRTFFASQFLTNAEKLRANDLLSIEDYEIIESCRYALLNLKWNIKEILPAKEMGVASVVSYYGSSTHNLHTKLIDGVPVCEIHFQLRDCFELVAEPSKESISFLENGVIDVDSDAKEMLLSGDCINIITKDEEPAHAFVDDIEEDDDEVETMPSESPQKEQASDNAEDKISAESETLESTEEILESIKIIVGTYKNGNHQVVFEPNNSKVVSHPNMGIIGTMGTGKTQFVRSVIAQFTKESSHNVGGNPVGMLIFDYKGDYKDSDFLNRVDGESYKYNYPFNPLKLVVSDEVVGMNLPAITADRIADSFAKAYGLGLKQQSNIKQVIIETYAEAGITRDQSTWGKPVPTMGQVIDKYFETYDANDKAYALFDKLRDYTIFTSDSTKCVSIFEWLKGVRVIDLTLYPDDTKRVIVSLILDLFYAEMRQLGESNLQSDLRELRAMVMVDEAHHFLKRDFNSFRSIISEGRMFGVGMILSTQNISDFKTNKEDYTQFILSWVIHHVNSISKAEITSIFGAGDSNVDRYMDYISKAQRFESICKIGHGVYGMHDLPYFELIQKDKRFNQESNNP